MSEQLQESSERVSALMDGQLHGDEFARTVDYLADTPTARDTWDTYHLVGEAMRSTGATLRMHDPDFVARLRLQMTAQAPQIIAATPLTERAEGLKGSNLSAANDARWKRVAGLLSIALVGVLAWQGISLMGASEATRTDVQLAQLPTQPAQTVTPATLLTADGSSALMIRDPQLDALLAAHRQMGGATALQMPSGFLRNATFDEGRR